VSGVTARQALPVPVRSHTASLRVQTPASTGSTVGNRIVTSAGTPWVGRGVNLPDTRSCNACSYSRRTSRSWSVESTRPSPGGRISSASRSRATWSRTDVSTGGESSRIPV